MQLAQLLDAHSEPVDDRRRNGQRLLSQRPALAGQRDPEGTFVVLIGVVGLITTGAILMINRRRPYHPALLIGLLPMVACGYWVLT